MNKIIKKVVSLSAALVMMSSATVGVGAYSGDDNAVKKNRTCTTTVGTYSGTVTYTNYYQTAVNADYHYYKMDGYVEIHKGPSDNCYRSITAKMVTYHSGLLGADDTAFKTHINGDNTTRSYWTASKLAITLEAVDYKTGEMVKAWDRGTKSNVHVYSQTRGVTRENSTDKTRVYCTLEAIYDDMDIVVVSRPTRVI